LITDEVLKEVEANIELAPLHNPNNIVGIVACQKHLPDIMQVGVFDTAFHQQMPAHAYLYGIPMELYRKHKVRRYGFHGTSHYFVANRAAEILKKPLKDLKIVTCHLGNGCSMTAVKGGISVDTSMGFTPVEGLLMGTRAGDMDPQIIWYIMSKEGISRSEAETLLNKQGGLAGISEISSDMREIEAAMEAGNQNAKIAFDIFCYQVKKYIGSYVAAMGGVDVVVFTGGIGENSPLVRKSVCEDMEFMGIKLDESKNVSKEKEKDISADASRVHILVIPTNEELVIAMDTHKIVSELKKN
jgi:acetate kinase